MTRWTLSLHNKPIKRFTIKEGWNLTIGRGADADVIVDNTAISRKHASIELKNGRYILSDLESLNGTYVNGKKISSAEYIKQDDIIKLGKFVLSVSDEAEDMATVSSYGAHPDTEDHTVIVSASRLEGLAKADSDRSVKKLLLLEGSAQPAKISLNGMSTIKIGKSLSCDMILKGLFIADAQFYIVRQGLEYKLIPQRSWAKTYVNGIKIKNEHLLANEDIIKVRSTKIRFCQ